MDIPTEFKLIIAGSRRFNDYALLRLNVDSFLDSINSDDPNHQKERKITIVSGHANGADMLGERYALEKGFAVEKYPANWYLYGKAAGPRRNRYMASIANACIVFWDGWSRGSKNMIAECKLIGIPFSVIRYTSPKKDKNNK